MKISNQKKAVSFYQKRKQRSNNSPARQAGEAVSPARQAGEAAWQGRAKMVQRSLQSQGERKRCTPVMQTLGSRGRNVTTSLRPAWST